MKHPGLPRFRLPASLTIASAGLAAILLGAPREAEARKGPIPVRGHDTIAAEIDPAKETDEYEVHLNAGDELRLNARATGPLFGLLVNLSLARPNGTAATATITGQGTARASLSYVSPETGRHVVKVAGGPGQFAGSTGNYQAAFAVLRVKPQKTVYEDPAGNAIAFDFPATAGARVTITAKTKAGTVVLTDLRRPDGTSEPAFADALKAPVHGRSAKAKKVLLGGGAGTYRLVGSYTAGAKPTLRVEVAHGEKKRTRRLGIEPDLHPSQQPMEGIAGVEMQVVATDLTYIPATRRKPLVQPRFFLGPVEVPQDTILHPNGILWVFPVPEGIPAGAPQDLRIENPDGQVVIGDDLLTIVPPPVVIGFTPTSGGPAGGRSIRISGTNFRSGTVVLFGNRVADPSITLPTRIDVKSPARETATGQTVVAVTVRDEFGQTATAAQQFTYLDVPTNDIESIDRTFLQSLGGEAVAVTGTGFVENSILDVDGVPVAQSIVSPTEMRFTSPQHADGTATLRVTDDYEQSDLLPITYKGFLDVTNTSVPAPRTHATFPNQEDGWRATRLVRGDLSGDGVADFVLLRGAPASGNSSARSRVRIFRTNSNGALEDRTSADFPAVAGSEDWGAADGALADLDGDGDADLAIVTPVDVSNGTRSSLRILLNNGSGAFTDATTASVPASTSWGDRNQGSAIVAEDVDGDGDKDLVLAHTAHFIETIVTLINPGHPGDPTANPPIPPQPPIYQTTINHYPAVRVLLNNGTAVFARSLGWIPAVNGTENHQFQAGSMAAGDVDADGDPDLVLTRHGFTVNPPGTVHRSGFLLRNGGTSYTDASAASLPAGADPEYLQGDRLVLADADGDGDLDLFVGATTPLVMTSTGLNSPVPAIRLFTNNAAGTFTASAAGTFPPKDGSDQNQCEGFALGDLSGDGRPDLVLVSARPPNSNGRGGRILVGGAAGRWTSGSLAFPNPLSADDCRGADVALSDLDGDGDLDVVIVRDDPDESVRNTRVLRNPRK